MYYPRISIVIATFNEERYIENCLNSLLNQTYQGEFDIIIADGNSTDRTIEIINHIKSNTSKFIVINNPKKIQAAGRNLAIKHSNSDFIAYIDAHSYAENDWLERLWTAYYNLSQKDENIAGISSVYYDAQKTSFSRALLNAYRSLLIGSSSKAFLNSNELTKVDNGYGILYKKEIIINAGLYDETLKTAEDIELNFRLTYKLGYNLYVEPKAKLYYYFKEKPKEVFTQQFRYGFWRIQAMKKLGIHNFKVYASGLTVLIFLLIIITTITHFNELRFLSLLIILYLFLLIIGSIYETIKNKINIFYLFINIISIQFGYGCGVIAGIIYLIFKSCFKKNEK